MGLDMYILRMNDDSEWGDEICYWRKANSIHNFFVDKYPTAHECILTPITLEDAWELLTVTQKCIDEILEKGYPADYCRSALPRMDGFFFGDQDYGSGYENQLIETIPQVLRLCLMMKRLPDEKFCYFASW